MAICPVKALRALACVTDTVPNWNRIEYWLLPSGRSNVLPLVTNEASRRIWPDTRSPGLSPKLAHPPPLTSTQLPTNTKVSVAARAPRPHAATANMLMMANTRNDPFSSRRMVSPSMPA